MKKSIFTLIAAICCTTLSLNAEAIYGTCGANMEWTFNTGSGALYLTGTGPMDDYSTTTATPWAAYAQQIIKIYVDGDKSQYTSFGKNAFNECKNLEAVEMPNTVVKIGEAAFRYCTKLATINMSTALTDIGYNAFNSCYSLTKITIPNSVLSIGSIAFIGCSGLTTVTIPAKVNMIGAGAFAACDKLTSINVYATSPYYRSEGGVLYSNNKTLLHQVPAGLTGEFHVPDGVTTVNAYAFYRCNKLADISMPTSVTSIGNYAFHYCLFESIEIPEGVTSLGYSAFYACTKLAKVILPSTLVNMDHGVFYLCTALTSVTCKATTPPSGGKNYFLDVDLSACKLYVPQSAVDDYKTADQWKDFGDNILPITTTAIDQLNHQSPYGDSRSEETTNYKSVKDGVLLIHHGNQTFDARGARVE